MAVFNIEVLDNMNRRIENELIPLIHTVDYEKIDEVIENIIQELHEAIPDKKRISYGITYVVKLLSKALYEKVGNSDLDTFQSSLMLYKNLDTFRTKCVGLGMVSYHGLKDVEAVLPYFKDAANHEIWEIREFAQMYIRKITKKYPNKVQAFLISLTKSENPNHRRFASECLRPVVENRWILNNPEFSLKVLRELFEESDPYPRVSVGNNLSDLSRNLPELVLNIVKELVSRENENSYWIATRACRNLVKIKPIQVMDILKVDTYVYKNKKYKRSDYEK
ncbi:hypothetical protein [Oceanirhabdus sp. W0125-5]|uniref:hypothetical protein n=1 Tax=Oceanirhabdus sp. W0125-5 TaxID=2999116 RepID=UPI0022F2CCBB|nr:hypothetical protein [Oceanirhabdus sp. W0125-5]WBW96847.1 hypothetical protein OW730_24625 [Oceanirhabdus sp. W0125-5]